MLWWNYAKLNLLTQLFNRLSSFAYQLFALLDCPSIQQRG
jgi:hypothetical protein